MKKPRIWYEFEGKKYLVPEQYIYQMHESRGGGFEIGADFYTWAFKEYGISIVEYKTLYGDQTNLQPAPKGKEQKDTIPVGVVYFAVACTGRDRKNITKTGVGEVGNESVNNFQRGFPYGLAAKRAKVDMGKEFFCLTNIRLATDCEDFICTNPKHKGKPLSEIFRADQSFIKWIAGPEFDPAGNTESDLLQTKCRELLVRIEEFRKAKAATTATQNPQ